MSTSNYWPLDEAGLMQVISAIYQLLEVVRRRVGSVGRYKHKFGG
jgi:hypothetical protein